MLTTRVEYQVNVKVPGHSCPMAHGASLHNFIHCDPCVSLQILLLHDVDTNNNYDFLVLHSKVPVMLVLGLRLLSRHHCVKVQFADWPSLLQILVGYL